MEVDYIAHCTPSSSNSATRCNESTSVGAQDLIVFDDFERTDWVAWDSSGGTTPAVVIDADMTYAEAMEFSIIGSTVVGFTTRAPFATNGIPYDASNVVGTATLEFDLKMTTSPGATDWKLKVESSAAATAVEVSLTSSQEGHVAPVLDVWQHYSFKLSDLAALGLDVAAIDLLLMFPEFGTGNGAVFRIDNVKILKNVAPTTVTTSSTNSGSSSSGGGSVGLWLMLILLGLSTARLRLRK